MVFCSSEFAHSWAFSIFAIAKIRANRCLRIANWRKTTYCIICKPIIETWLNLENSTKGFAIIRRSVFYILHRSVQATLPYLTQWVFSIGLAKQTREECKLCPFLVVCYH